MQTRLGYIWNYKSNYENLQKELEKLQGTSDIVKHRVEAAKRNGENIEVIVVNWLDSVEKKIEEVSKDIEDYNNGTNMCCFKSLCPDLKKRYRLGKIAAVKAIKVSELVNEGNFDSVSYRTPPKQTWRSDGYEYFQSRQSTLEGIVKALCDPDVNMVGVHGLGGSGKTTLVREVARIVEEDKLFDEVVFAEVSDTVDIRKIQDIIAERLGFGFKEHTEYVRANRLRERIKQEGKILIILDNIWKDLNLAAVGIPLGNNHKGCKLLFTSRRMDLLREMGSENNFRVHVLEEDEAWNLFKKISGVGDDQPLALEVAKECEGLLVAIITIAKALKNKQEYEWGVALHELRNPPPVETVEGLVVEKTYASIHLSYKYLEIEKLKSIFLLCCIMGSTVDASIEDVLRYAMGLSLLEEDTLEDARGIVKQLIRKLKDSSLLLGTSNSETYSVHNVVRNVGRWIAEKDHHKLTVINNIIPRGWAGQKLRDCTSITLHDIKEVPQLLECPHLKFFYMKTKTRLPKLSDDFFEGMRNLEVLHLIGIDLSPLPASLRLLKDLRMLNLERCVMKDIADIVHMKNLEIILLVSFDDTFKYNQLLLPEEIGQLKQLRLLDLRINPFVVPPNTVSRLTQLEELYVGRWYIQQRDEKLNIESSISSVEDLKDLVKLTVLDIHVDDPETLPKGLIFQELKRCNIVIGSHEESRASKSFFGEKVVFPNLKNLELHGIKLKNIWSKQLPLCFQSLTRFIVHHCSNMQYVFSSSTLGSFKQLQQLEINGCEDLEELIRIDDKYTDCVEFLSLEKLKIEKCPELREFIFGNKVLFPRLQEIIIKDMENLKMIWQNQLIEGVQYSPKLCKMSIRFCPILENIFSAAITMSIKQLEEVEVSFCGIKEIVAKEERVNEEAPRFVFPKLHSLYLSYLEELRCFYPSKHTTECPKLKRLEVKNCEKLNLFNLQENDEGQVQQPLFVVDKSCGSKNLEEKNHCGI